VGCYEEKKMTPFFESVLIPQLRELNRRCGPIHAQLLADLLNLSERTCRNYLRLLEKIGMVARPFGQRRGWLVAV
jgi:predicted transcriptional regulator